VTWAALDLNTRETAMLVGVPREKLEAAILTQLTGIYRDGRLTRDAIEQAAASDYIDRTALTEQRASLAKEITRSERNRPLPRRLRADDLNPAHFSERRTTLKARLDALNDQNQHSPTNQPQTRRPRLTRRHSAPSPTTSIKPSTTASPSKPRHSSPSSSQSCASTAAARSCPPTTLVHPWFAHR
jgi:hypothetical protein